MTFKFDKEREKLVITKATRSELHQLSLSLNRFAKGYQFNPSFKMRVWDGKIVQFKNGEVDMGLWKECLKAASTIEVPFIIENKEDFPVNRDITLEKVQSWSDSFFKDTKMKRGTEVIEFKPHDYQIESVYKILKNRYCILEASTSSGKTITTTMVFLYILENLNPDAKMLLIVPSISLVSQFYDDAIALSVKFKPEDYRTKQIIDVELENGDIISFCENDMVETKNRGMVMAKDLNEDDEI